MARLDGSIETELTHLRDWAATLDEYDAETRLYRFEIDGDAPRLLLEAFYGSEGLSQLDEYQILVLSTDVQLDLDALRWRLARLRVRLADGTEQIRSGYIQRAESRGADGGLARYALTLVPWCWLLTQQSHSRIWQDQPLADVIADVFTGYADADWAFADGVTAELAALPLRPYCVQYRESDHAFLSRLLSEVGLGWMGAESAADTAGAETLSRPRLIVFSNTAQFPETEADAGNIRFHRASATESRDTLQALTQRAQLGSAGFRHGVFDAQRKYSRSAAQDDAISSVGGADLPMFVRYHYAGHDEAGGVMDDARASRLMQEAQVAEGQRLQASGTVRGLRVGQRFKLTQGSAIDDGAVFSVTRVRCVGFNNLPTGHQAARAVLRADCAAGIAFETLDQLLAQAESHGYAAQFDLLPAETPWRPLGAGARAAHAPGPQSATVVDNSGRTDSAVGIHRDRQGRIRVRFHWQNDAGNQGDAGNTAQASCWLRLASRAAGAQRGLSFIPRLGQEVLVGFLDHDIDRPIILGALYNGKGEGAIPATPGGQRPASATVDPYTQAADRRASAQGNSHGGNSPAWHGHSAEGDGHANPAAINGYKSQEIGGSGYSHIAFDDRDDQLRIQLKTTRAATELNLGQLIHQADNHRGSIRGSGYELRSDGGGVIRAGQGVLIESRRGQSPGNQAEPSGDFTAGTALVQQAQNLARHYDQAAQSHNATGLSGHRGSHSLNGSRNDHQAAPLAALRTIAEGQVSGNDAQPIPPDEKPKPGANRSAPIPHLRAPIIALSAQAQLGVIAGQALQLSAGESIISTSGGDQDLAAGGSLRIHSGQSIGVLAGVNANAENPGLSAIAASGPLTIQAQNGPLNLDAKADVQLISISQTLEAAAKTAITLITQQGAAITIDDGNITVACPGTITIQAGNTRFTGPLKKDQALPQFQVSEFKRKRFQSFSG